MSVITMSPSLVRACALAGPCVPNGYYYTEFPSQTGLFNYQDTNRSRIRIYKGVMPTANEISTSTLRTDQFRSSDMLIDGNALYGGGSQEYDEVAIVNNEVIIRSKITKQTLGASQSGVASWFMWANFVGGYGPVMSTAGIVLVGDITGPGGGGALEIDNVNIVAGLIYQLKEYSFRLPQSWSFT